MKKATDNLKNKENTLSLKKTKNKTSLAEKTLFQIENPFIYNKIYKRKENE